MKNSTAKFRWTPMRVAWTLACVISLGGGSLVWFVPALRYSVVQLSVEEKERGETEKKIGEVKKPEPTEKQVKEIAKRVEEKKKDVLAKEVRELEQALEEMEKQKEERLAAIGIEAEDFFKIQLEAIALKAIEVRERSGLSAMPGNDKLRPPADKIKEDAAALSRFPDAEAPGLTDAVGDLLQKNAALQQMLEERINTFAPNEARFRTFGWEARTATLELADLLRRVVKEVPASAERPPELQAMTKPEPLTEPEIEAMTPAELYDQARELDEALRDTFADARAAELAQLQDQDLAGALNEVTVPATNAPDLSAELEKNNPANREEFQAFNEALDEAANATQSMRLGAESMLAKAQEAGTGGTKEEAAVAVQVRTALQKAATAAAQSRGQVVNLVPMMSAAYGPGVDGNFDGGGGGAAGSARIAQGGESTIISEATSEQPAPIQLRHGEIVSQVLPGRKFSRNSKRQGWLYIDTWYVIGPFARPPGAIVSLQTNYPPDTIIDLDATYPGKPDPSTGKPIELRWRFFQSNILRSTPPDESDGSIYYAYTEVYFDEEDEVLIAVASDDAAKVWINDLVVWEDVGLSGWRLDEGFRRVVFRKGYNRVLMRIENGPGVCVFSILLCPLDLSTAQR